MQKSEGPYVSVSAIEISICIFFFTLLRVDQTERRNRREECTLQLHFVNASPPIGAGSAGRDTGPDPRIKP
jgi:hypothetical protein